ncbi:hypothetical protein ACWPM1_09790 [Tsuneonella sp. HG249]
MSPVVAQDRSDRVRLDDFALPAPEQPLRVDQVPGSGSAAMPQQSVDRTLGTAVRSEPSGAMPSQVSTADSAAPMRQLVDTAQSRTALTGAVSNAKDSQPGGVQRIGGADRCDPQLARRVYLECLRILELRADEFDAPQPATLSPEQRLLAEQREMRDTQPGSFTMLRAKIAGGEQPDADLESYQELASIYLSGTDQPAEPTPTEPDEGSGLADILQRLGIPNVIVPPTE